MNSREVLADLYRQVLDDGDEAPRTPDLDGLTTLLIERLHFGPGCDHTYRVIVDILRDFGKTPSYIEDFLTRARAGGHCRDCDCEILFNVLLKA
jgi:hypothetical protein